MIPHPRNSRVYHSGSKKHHPFEINQSPCSDRRENGIAHVNEGVLAKFPDLKFNARLYCIFVTRSTMVRPFESGGLASHANNESPVCKSIHIPPNLN
jgi:hypothetical protein